MDFRNERNSSGVIADVQIGENSEHDDGISRPSSLDDGQFQHPNHVHAVDGDYIPEPERVCQHLAIGFEPAAG